MAVGGVGERLTYRPEWNAAFEGWSRNFIRRNHWRVAAILEPEEAVQECALVFARCADRYAGKVDNPAWFMSLFQRAVGNHFNNLALSNERAARAAAAIAELPNPNHIEWNNGPLLTALGEASEELRQVLVLALVKAPHELARLMLGGPRSDPAAWSRSLCRWARLPVRNDLIRELKKLLG